jgi:hypothetical protein
VLTTLHSRYSEASTTDLFRKRSSSTTCSQKRLNGLTTHAGHENAVDLLTRIEENTRFHIDSLTTDAFATAKAVFRQHERLDIVSVCISRRSTTTQGIETCVEGGDSLSDDQVSNELPRVCSLASSRLTRILQNHRQYDRACFGLVVTLYVDPNLLRPFLVKQYLAS